MKKIASALTALLAFVMIAAPSAQAEDAAKPTPVVTTSTTSTSTPPIPKLDPCGGC